MPTNPITLRSGHPLFIVREMAYHSDFGGRPSYPYELYIVDEDGKFTLDDLNYPQYERILILNFETKEEADIVCANLIQATCGPLRMFYFILHGLDVHYDRIFDIYRLLEKIYKAANRL